NPSPRALPSVALLVPGVPHEVDQVLARMTAFDPAQRYAEPAAVLHALLPFMRPERPAHPAPAGPAADEAQAAPTPAVRAVLVVDDEEGIRQYTRLVLQGEALRCDVVNDGAAGLEALARQPYDLVLVDVCLPDMKGPELLRRLREEPPVPHLKVIMISG